MASSEAGHHGGPNAELAAQRLKLFEDAVALRKPERVPLMPLALEYFHTRAAGVSDKDAGYNAQLNFRCLRDATVRFGWDWAPGMAVPPSRSLEALGSRQIRWPGGDLPDDVQFQWVEDEYLKADEYDAFLADPTRFTLHTLWPRLASAFGVLGELPLPPVWWINTMYFPLAWGALLGAPPMTALFEALAEMSRDAGAFMAAFGRFMGEMTAMGYPVAFVGVTKSPFDTVSDDYRGLRGSTLDLYRQPEKLQALTEMLTPMVIGQAIGAVKGSGNPRVFIPLHRGAAGFLNDEQFARYYWPGLKALIFALLDAGVTPCPFFEGDYTPRLKYLAELPPGVVAAHFDRTDRKKFKEMCGHNLCFWGDVPGSLMVTGAPGEVKDYVKGLIDDFADSGGLIVDGANAITGEARPENVMALREAVDEYGVY
jgi:hypothetical protein